MKALLIHLFRRLMQDVVSFSHNARRHRQTRSQSDRQTTLLCQKLIILCSIIV